MLSIRVELLHEVLRAGSPDDIAMTGLEDPGEWPPSPARLFSALVAAAGTGARCVIGDGSELELLESADPPQIVADAPEEVLRSPILPRFVVVDELHRDQTTTKSVHEYVARSNATARPGTRIALKQRPCRSPDSLARWMRHSTSG